MLAGLDVLFTAFVVAQAVTAAGGGGITDPNPANTESLYVYALP